MDINRKLIQNNLEEVLYQYSTLDAILTFKQHFGFPDKPLQFDPEHDPIENQEERYVIPWYYTEDKDLVQGEHNVKDQKDGRIIEVTFSGKIFLRWFRKGREHG